VEVDEEENSEDSGQMEQTEMTPGELQEELQKPKKPNETIFQVVNKIDSITSKLGLGNDDQIKIESFYVMCGSEYKVLEHLTGNRGLWAFPDGTVNWKNFAKCAMEMESYTQQMILLQTPQVVWETVNSEDEESDQHVQKYFADKSKEKIAKNRKILQGRVDKKKLKKKEKEGIRQKEI